VKTSIVTLLLLPVLQIPITASTSVPIATPTVKISQESFPEMGSMTVCRARWGQLAFLFAPPSQWSINTTPGTADLHLQFEDLSEIRIRLIPQPSGHAPHVASHMIRDHILAKWPNASLGSTFPAYAANTLGTVIDFEWSTPHQTTFHSRIVRVEIERHLLEFEFHSQLSSFPVREPAFNAILSSFQIDGS
jgi:hypothetical protein